MVLDQWPHQELNEVQQLKKLHVLEKEMLQRKQQLDKLLQDVEDDDPQPKKVVLDDDAQAVLEEELVVLGDAQAALEEELHEEDVVKLANLIFIFFICITA